MRQVLRRHHHAKLDLGVKVEEPRLGEPGHVRGLRDLDNQNATALAVALAEVSSLRLDVVENLLHRGSSRSISNLRVERLNWAIYQHHHPHIRSPGALKSLANLRTGSVAREKVHFRFLDL